METDESETKANGLFFQFFVSRQPFHRFLELFWLTADQMTCFVIYFFYKKEKKTIIFYWKSSLL